MVNDIKKKNFFKSYEFMLLSIIVILTIVLSILTKGKFTRIDNIIDMIISYSAYGVISLGCLFVIISGGIDISFMAVGAVGQYLAALYMLHFGGNFLIVFAISIISGILLGFVNAILVNKSNIPTLIITIATMNIIYGLMMRLTKGVRLHGFPNWFAEKTPVTLFVLSIGILVLMIVLSWYILTRTKVGRKIYAIGGNMEAAKRCGINVLNVHLFVYGFAGAMASIGAIIKCYLAQQASIAALYGDEMDVIAMVVLGGVSLSGGKGNVFGTFLGIILIAILSNGMILVGVSSYWKDMVIGLVILIGFCCTGYRLIKAKQNEKKGVAA